VSSRIRELPGAARDGSLQGDQGHRTDTWPTYLLYVNNGKVTTPPTTDTALAGDLVAVVANIHRLANQRVRTLLPYARARLLSAIDEHNSARLCDLAALDYCSQPVMTTQVRRLEDARLVSRTTDSADARSVRIHITAAGRSVLAQVRADRGATIDQHLARLDDADRRTLAEAVRIMRSLLNDAQRHR
jgi:DNA-binding MarR family transcriptional regulator